MCTYPIDDAAPIGVDEASEEQIRSDLECEAALPGLKHDGALVLHSWAVLRK